ncbi:XRE family transcriptional regulator [Mesotoga sp. UBA6090]|uniref:XRE family transcriptional regulator n=1 Tax=Mesotoga sp. UBA6090 TaxID=1946860 RepID=UPI0025DF1487|nr:LexA family transcriptional regulator [Mesotoga sp. UBA6090]
MSIGKRILETRKAKGFTRNHVALRSGLTAASIYHYETGRRVPSTDAVGKVAKALDVDVNFLLGFEPLDHESIPFYDIDMVDLESTEGVTNTIVKVFGADFATTVPDNAMFPDFKQGDIIFLKKSEYKECSGRIVLVSINDEKLLRRLILKNREEMTLTSTNPEFSPVELEMLDWKKGKAEFIGVVVGKASEVY